MLHPRRFVRDSLGIALSQYVARAAILVRGVVAAAALGPGGYGTWNALNLIFDYGSYASAGAIQGLDLVLPGATGDRARARRTMSAAWSVILAGAGLFAMVVIAIVVFRPSPIAASRSRSIGLPML